VLEPTVHRAALVFTVSVLVLISVVCAVFLIAGIEIPNWFVVAGRWIPALVALAVIVAYKFPGGVLERLQLRPWGFWRASIVIAVVWVIFHIPLHGTMVLQGALDPHIGVASTVVLFGLGLFLSAVTVRFGSVWPAAFAHAVPFSVLNLVEDPEGLSPGHLYGLTAVTIAVLIVVAAVIAPKENQPS